MALCSRRGPFGDTGVFGCERVDILEEVVNDRAERKCFDSEEVDGGGGECVLKDLRRM